MRAWPIISARTRRLTINNCNSQNICVRSWDKLWEIGFGSYRDLLKDYGIDTSDGLRAGGETALARKLTEEMGLPKPDVDRIVGVVFARPIAGTVGGMYDATFLRTVKPLYDMHMGVENMGPLLYSLVRFIKPRHVLEIGAGYTTIFILQALRDNAIELANSLSDGETKVIIGDREYFYSENNTCF